MELHTLLTIILFHFLLRITNHKKIWTIELLLLYFEKLQLEMASTTTERISSNLYLVEYFVFCPLLCEKEGQVWFESIVMFDRIILLGRKKNSVLLSRWYRYWSSNTKCWILWRFSEIYRVNSVLWTMRIWLIIFTGHLVLRIHVKACIFKKHVYYFIKLNKTFP